MNIEQYAAKLEAAQANRDFMNEWINKGRPFADVVHLRDYRETAENVFFRSFEH